MSKSSVNRIRLAALLACLLGSSVSLAQQPGRVVESQPAGQAVTSAAGAAGNNDALMLLLEQNRNLQAEVQALRAMVEEQGYQIRRLQQESMDRYTNTDSRLTNLEQALAGGTAISATSAAPGGQPLPPSAASTNLPSDTTSTLPQSATGATIEARPQRGISSGPVVSIPDNRQTPGQTGSAAAQTGSTAVQQPPVNSPATSTIARNASTSRPALEPAVLTEQQLYQMAYNSAINSQFERAIAEFDQYLSLYPQGRFTTNAHYWKGQSYLYLSRYEEAINAYNIILEQYPDDAKVPDSMYGLGVAYEGIGDNQRARQLMQTIKRRFPNTGVANLADTRLLSLD